MQINPSEITKILKEQIKNFGEKAEISEVGKVLSVGDGIARVLAWTTFKRVRWLNSKTVLKVWRLT